jgi:hypothetical protein
VVIILSAVVSVGMGFLRTLSGLQVFSCLLVEHVEGRIYGMFKKWHLHTDLRIFLIFVLNALLPTTYATDQKLV